MYKLKINDTGNNKDFVLQLDDMVLKKIQEYSIKRTSDTNLVELTIKTLVEFESVEVNNMKKELS